MERFGFDLIGYIKCISLVNDPLVVAVATGQIWTSIILHEGLQGESPCRGGYAHSTEDTEELDATVQSYCSHSIQEPSSNAPNFLNDDT